MTRPPVPWSLEWTSSGELAPLDRQDLFLVVCRPGVVTPLADTSATIPSPLFSFSPTLVVSGLPRSLPASS
jgi:hypothetical protein